jgi:hypothetical protein
MEGEEQISADGVMAPAGIVQVRLTKIMYIPIAAPLERKPRLYDHAKHVYLSGYYSIETTTLGRNLIVYDLNAHCKHRPQRATG